MRPCRPRCLAAQVVDCRLAGASARCSSRGVTRAGGSSGPGQRVRGLVGAAFQTLPSWPGHFGLGPRSRLARVAGRLGGSGAARRAPRGAARGTGDDRNPPAADPRRDRGGGRAGGSGVLDLGVTAVAFAAWWRGAADGAAPLRGDRRGGQRDVAHRGRHRCARSSGSRCRGRELRPGHGVAHLRGCAARVGSVRRLGCRPRRSPLGDRRCLIGARMVEGLSEVLRELLGDPSFRVQQGQSEESVRPAGPRRRGCSGPGWWWRLCVTGRVCSTMCATARPFECRTPGRRERQRRALVDHRTTQLVAARARLTAPRIAADTNWRWSWATRWWHRCGAPVAEDAWGDRGGAESAAEVALAAQQVHTALAALEGLVRGAPPAVLGGGRLGPAIERLGGEPGADHRRPRRRRSTAPGRGCPLYVCPRHSRTPTSTPARLGSVCRLCHNRDAIVLVVTDDGIGGADPAGPAYPVYPTVSRGRGRLVVSSPSVPAPR